MFFLECEEETWGFEKAHEDCDYDKIRKDCVKMEFTDKGEAIKAFCKISRLHLRAGQSTAKGGINNRKWIVCDRNGQLPIEICFNARLYDEDENLIISSSIIVYRNKDCTLSGMRLRE